ncbi:MAG: hypothetical protein N2044_00700 [Cyclobacteriaceae bacterium]|nr:hypothetical protein [Cyclobacteriaceae bacterium]MCX7636339.1 hypothetical protein [Cyclobacteriaceae bacterium]MDW8330304.1 hypothetical protein [Cyclobacteriaceae bacterium]
MKLADVVLLSLSAAFLIIGIHQLIVRGIGHAYSLFMLSAVLFLWYSYRKRK